MEKTKKLFCTNCKKELCFADSILLKDSINYNKMCILCNQQYNYNRLFPKKQVNNRISY